MMLDSWGMLTNILGMMMTAAGHNDQRVRGRVIGWTIVVPMMSIMSMVAPMRTVVVTMMMTIVAPMVTMMMMMDRTFLPIVAFGFGGTDEKFHPQQSVLSASNFIE